MTLAAVHAMPEALIGRPFTRAQAGAHGVSARMLEGRRFVRLFSGVYRCAETPESLPLLLSAGHLALGFPAAVSHLTCLRLMGFEIGPSFPLHFSTNDEVQVVQPGIVLHRRQGRLHVRECNGFLTTGAMRTFIDAATLVDDRSLLRIGDWLVTAGHVELDRLREYVTDSHLNGVARARRVAKLISTNVGSPRESDLRWELHRAGLPMPEVNADIRDAHGQWLARGDLVFRRWKVLVEYDGWQHERDARQRQWDHLRRESLEADGWRVIVVTAVDMATVSTVIARVRQALRARGCPA
jgi:hypothetical protein